MPLDEDEARFFHDGLDLFNEGEWFEAHEAWEDAWRLASGERKRFYQGLIQAAVTLEHLRRGNPRGVRSVHASMKTKFVGLPDVYRGVNVRRLLEDVDRVVAPVLALPAETFDPARERGQTLPVDWAAAPKIELESDPFPA